jgi:hypothetical protein
MLFQLSSLADGELGGANRAEVAAHVESREECRATLDAFRAVKAWASSDAATPADRAAPAAWSQLRDRLPVRGGAGRFGGWGRLSIAASLMIFVAGSGVWWRVASTEVATVTEPDAVAPLEALVQARLAAMPAAKSQALRSSLQIIDAAIADAGAARIADPRNEFVAAYLDNLLKRKADALREVLEMTAAESAS